MSSNEQKFVAETTAEMITAAEQKIQVCSAIRTAIEHGLVHLERFPRTGGLRARLIGQQATLAEFEALEQKFLADVLQMRREQG